MSDSDDHQAGFRLETPPSAAAVFHVVVLEVEAGLRLTIVDERGQTFEGMVRRRFQPDYTDLFDAAAKALDLRRPLAREIPPAGNRHPGLRAVLTQPVAPEILYGYGDPCVVRVGPSDYRLLVTSNDAPNAFPILSSCDLRDWRLTGFVFPEGATPTWALTGAEISDFWAPELHKVGAEWWVCFAARAQDRSLAIGLARADEPDGPFVADPEPLVVNDVIDPHILIDAEDRPWLIWKKDDNGLWPALLAELMNLSPWLSTSLFGSNTDRRTAALALTLWPWIRTLEPMERFFVLQPLIEAVALDLDGFAARLQAAAEEVEASDAKTLISRIARALKTRIFAQRLSPEGRRLEGEPVVILQNDLPWEGHLIEGVWVTQEEGRYFLLYAGNDFSTGYYGVGAAVADSPTGPYRKRPEVLVGSTGEWWGPGHPSVTTLDDGRRQVFLHAYAAGLVGYKQFRALLTASITFGDGAVSIGDAPS